MKKMIKITTKIPSTKINNKKLYLLKMENIALKLIKMLLLH